VIDSEKTFLLVVDDESSVCRVVKRLLKNRFDEIAIAETPADAETVLASCDVTHVICDHVLGPGCPRGLELASHWKAAHPSIKKIIVLTGANVADLGLPPGIDFVVPKTTDPVDLASLLGV
jgi:DNA-binding NtrC family response regulator